QLVRFMGWEMNMIRAQLDADRWQRVHYGVYATSTGVLTIEAQWWAAHLRCGDQSALDGESALHAWRVRTSTSTIEVVVPSEQNGHVPEITVRRTRTPIVSRSPNGLPPALAPQIALLHVSNRLSTSKALDLVGGALQSGRVQLDAFARALASQRVKHRRALTALLAEHRDGLTTSIEVAGVNRILRAHCLPVGTGQQREHLGGRSVIRDRVIGKLVIEFDGRVGHADATGRFRDLNRDNAALASGRPTLRFGWVDVHDFPCAAADQVAKLLNLLDIPFRIAPCSPLCLSEVARFQQRA
ncbi:MAG: hypothetical protein WC054_09220, partial [Candidatus Nanopelagicales bacterium]